MHPRFRLTAVCLIVLVVCGAVYLACSQSNEDTSEEATEQRESILVTKDELYDFQVDDEIGKVEYHKTRGPVGSRMEALCIIDRLTSFTDRTVHVRLELLNQDATRSGFEPVEWVQDSNKKPVIFYIPLVETVPVVLNFRLLVYDEGGGTDDTADDTAADDTSDDAADDTSDDTADDTADDDTALFKAGDDDTSDDTAADDDNPLDFDAPFMAEARIFFIVNDGTPGTGD